ncbi:MAG: calcium-binding protein, partial [Marinibacterium sp.]
GGAGDDTMGLGIFADMADNGGIHTFLDGGTGDDPMRSWVEAYGQTGLMYILAEVIGGQGHDHIEINSASFNMQGLDIIHNKAEGGPGDDTVIAVSFTGSTNAGAYLTQDLSGGHGNDYVDGIIEMASDHRVFAKNTVVGGDGADLLNAEIGISLAAQDSLGVNIINAGAGNDTVFAQFSYYSATRIDDEISYVFGGTGNDSLTVIGGTKTQLHGGLGDDVMTGGDADDWFVGGIGNDDVTTGLGTDSIAFTPNRDEGTDWIRDFDATTDRLVFEGLTDQGAPGLVDDLDALATFNPGKQDVWIELASGTQMVFVGTAFAGATSFADLVDDPATQLLIGQGDPWMV